MYPYYLLLSLLSSKKEYILSWLSRLLCSIMWFQGIQKYQKYLEDVGKLSKCEVLVVRFAVSGYAIKLALLHLLKKCSGVKKIVVDYLVWRNVSVQFYHFFVLWSKCQFLWIDNTKKWFKLKLEWHYIRATLRDSLIYRNRDLSEKNTRQQTL
jgi:hypothetical protein